LHKESIMINKQEENSKDVNNIQNNSRNRGLNDNGQNGGGGFFGKYLGSCLCVNPAEDISDDESEQERGSVLIEKDQSASNSGLMKNVRNSQIGDQLDEENQQNCVIQ